MKTPQKKQDNSLFYTIIVMVIVVIASGLFYYQANSVKPPSSDLGYGELKQTIIEDVGVVAQMTAAAQVHEDDLSWYKKNEKAIYEAYKIEMETIDLNTLNSKKGLEDAQKELRRKINLMLKTDKIQAVMFTDLILQHDQ
jgi:flagellar basal body-associated protein FliL